MLLQIYPYAGYGWLSQALAWLEAIGLLESIIPFVLIFTVLYAILSRIKLFDRKINMVIALAIALIPVLQHVAAPSPHDVVSVMNAALPSIVLLAIALLMILVLTGFAAGKEGIWEKLTGWLPWVALALVVLIFVAAAAVPIYPLTVFWQIFDPYIAALVVAILVVGLLVGYVTGPTREEKIKELEEKLAKATKAEEKEKIEEKLKKLKGEG